MHTHHGQHTQKSQLPARGLAHSIGRPLVLYTCTVTTVVRPTKHHLPAPLRCAGAADDQILPHRFARGRRVNFRATKHVTPPTREIPQPLHPRLPRLRPGNPSRLSRLRALAANSVYRSCGMYAARAGNARSVPMFMGHTPTSSAARRVSGLRHNISSVASSNCTPCRTSRYKRVRLGSCSASALAGMTPRTTWRLRLVS